MAARAAATIFMQSRARGITASLNRLGIPVTTGQWVGAVLAVLAGIVIARVLPYVYPIFFSPLLDLVFEPGPSTLRDGFNSFLMTVCTGSTSFIVSSRGGSTLRYCSTV
jgi:hypothetical protein